MKRMTKNICLSVLGTVLLLAGTGCERRPLEDVETIGLMVKVNWKYYEMTAEKPTGMTVVFQD